MADWMYSCCLPGIISLGGRRLGDRKWQAAA